MGFSVTTRDFLKSFRLLWAVLFVIVCATAYILIQLYRTSSLLLEANRRSFVQKVETSAAILNDFLGQRVIDMDTLSQSQALQSYYHNKALGMSMEYGLAVSLAAFTKELERFNRIMLEDGAPLFGRVDYFDVEERKIISESHSSHQSGRGMDGLIESIKANSDKGHAFCTVTSEDCCQLYLLRRFTYKGSVKGFLVMELDLERAQAQEKIQIKNYKNQHDFQGLIDSKGILISGPQELVGKKIVDTLGISPDAIRKTDIVEIPRPAQGMDAHSLIICGSHLANAGLFLIRVEPISKYTAGPSWTLWPVVFLGMASNLILMLALIFKGFNERQRMFGQLQEAHNNLERRVDERTKALAETNRELKKEMTEREQAQKDLIQSEAKYRSLAELLPQIAFETDSNGKFNFVNHSGLSAVGYTSEDLAKGINIIDVIADEDRDRLIKNFARALQQESTSGVEYRIRKKDGTVFSVATYTAPIVHDTEIMGVRGVCVDTTALKKIQEELFQSQKMEAIGTLAGGIAHDFNNILAVIQGYSELLLMNKTESDEEYGDLNIIMQTAGRGADLVKQILAFSRKAETQLRPVDLNREVDEALKMLSRTIPKMITIDAFLGDGPKRVNADPSQIHQVILNLAINARDAMPGGGRLTIETEDVQRSDERLKKLIAAKPGNYALLKVSDTGHGMEKQVRERIFDPFYTTKEPGRGTGLGLSMVLGIVQAHGGYIFCDSSPGRGTNFEIYFPAIHCGEIPKYEYSVTNTRGGSETILLVDDEELVRDLGTRILSRAGYKVLTATDGKDAIELYKAKKDEIALILLDLIMPKMGGQECFKNLLKIDPLVKVVIASGYSAEIGFSESRQFSAKGFIAKPYNTKEILQEIRRVLDSQLVRIAS